MADKQYLRSAGFLALQFGSGAIGMLLWAALSYVGPEYVRSSAQALAYGMVIYLPLTLGLPSILPNLYRPDSAQRDAARLALRHVVATTFVVALTATVLSLAQVLSATWAAALSFAALICASSTLQQVARLSRSLSLMGIACCYSALLPGASLGIAWTNGDPDLLAPTLSLATLAVVAPLILHRRALAPDGRGSGRDLIRRAAPLIPHMLAFAVLCQGLRIPASIADSDITQPHVIMLVVGLALAVISGVNSLLSVDLQSSPLIRTPALLARNVKVYSVLGAVTSMGVALFFATPIRNLFEGTTPPSLFGLGALALVPSGFCVYFFATSILLHAGRTSSLALASTPVAAIYLFAGTEAASRFTRTEPAVALFATAVISLAAITIVIAYKNAEVPIPCLAIPWLLGSMTPGGLLVTMGLF